MADDIILTATTRNTLLALQRVNALIGRTANRIVTGQRVSVIDDPTAFFEARSLTVRAGRLLTVKDAVDLAASTLQSTVAAIASIDAIIDQMKALALSAKSQNNNDAALTAAQFDILRTQVDNLVGDATFNSCFGGTTVGQSASHWGAPPHSRSRRAIGGPPVGTATSRIASVPQVVRE